VHPPPSPLLLKFGAHSLALPSACFFARRYLVLQDVPKGQDHAPSRTFYTWRATGPAANARLGEELYRAAGNLLARQAAEMESRRALLEKVEQVAAGAMAASALDPREVASLRGVTRALEAALLRLDEQIAVFDNL
jgi:DNA-directed RNA polymerase III subunit RPC3